MKKYISEKLGRKTGNNLYLPFVDGIRFIAVFMIVIFHLKSSFLTHFGTIDNGFFKGIVLLLMNNGNRGVEIFFVLSAFILGFQELNCKRKYGTEQKAGIFYKRRFMRIYPPFLLAMMIIFAGNVWVTHQYTFEELLPSFLSTITYTNNIASHFFLMPCLSMVTWTLEIEIQFYLLFPIIRKIYLLPVFLRRALLCSAILFFTFIQLHTYSLPATLLSYSSYFFTGLLLADLYFFQEDMKFNRYKIASLVLSLSCLVFVLVADMHFMYNVILYPVVLGGFFYFSINSLYMRTVLGCSVVSIIGAMCYSIYLMHTSVISFLNDYLVSSLPLIAGSGIFVWALANILLIVSVSLLYYLFVERPFMASGNK